MKKILLAATLVGGAGLSYADSGFYLGVGAGLGTINSSTTNGFQFIDGNSNKAASTMAGNIFAGYDFSRYVGVQADYTYIANVSYNTGLNPQTGSQGSMTANLQLLDVGVTGHLPFGLFSNALNGLSVFGRLALGYTTASFNGGTAYSSGSAGANYVAVPGNANSVVPVVGAGVEYGWSNVGLRLEYNYIGNTTVTNSGQTLMNVNNNLALFSVLYHF